MSHTSCFDSLKSLERPHIDPTRSKSSALHHALPPARRIRSCGDSVPLIEVVSPDELLNIPCKPPPSTSPASKDATPNTSPLDVSMVYNEYGELVREEMLLRHPTSSELTTTQLLRVIKKAYHHAYRNRTGMISVPQMDSKSPVILAEGLWKDRSSTWNLNPEPSEAASTPITDESPLLPIYHGPPHVLEIGCSDGSWCFNFKKLWPKWIVEGMDDTAHWACIEKDRIHGDFMATPAGVQVDDYFSKVRFKQNSPEFTVRNINGLLSHADPIPQNLYEFIRAREIFDRIESYKTFLEEVRSILKPDGVVEFLEIDPRPRVNYNCRRSKLATKHKSTPQTDWTDKILDRFKNPFDQELAKDVPGWAARVEERLKASLRPHDGVPAANLKSWLEGAGFWDVEELVLPIPVGGHTRSGQLLKDFLNYQVELENYIPKLVTELPKIETSALERGSHCLNLHIVTARKPKDPRPGDLLVNGTRQEMTAAKYHTMARFDAMKSAQWQRFDLGLPHLIQTLTLLPGAPKSPGQLLRSRGIKEERLLALVKRDSAKGKFPREGVLESPPFVITPAEEQPADLDETYFQ